MELNFESHRSKLNLDNSNFATATNLPILDPIDIHKQIRQKKISLTANKLVSDDITKLSGNALELEWLPFAAKQYNISPNIEDYILVPVFVVPASIPNRNRVGFLLEDLITFSVEMGMQYYKTWKGKPTFYEHQNDNPLLANGVILDTMLKKSTKGNFWKVFNYMAFDRSKYSELIQRVIRKQVTTYSMGAAVSNFECSICGRDIGRCNHISKYDTNMKLIDTGLDRPELAFQVGRTPVGFETSIVEDPAWIVADNDYVQILS